jgi:hypothetical protein
LLDPYDAEAMSMAQRVTALAQKAKASGQQPAPATPSTGAA